MKKPDVGSTDLVHGASRVGRRLDFVDLFAGLGGFHLALADLGHRCVFASEIDDDLQAIYERNFGLRPHGDIREIALGEIPRHDLLTAGFPCQPFSKAGEQNGFECPRWGDLFDFVIRVLAHHRPSYFIVENVPNIVKHDDGRTWEAILAKLTSSELGYDIRSGRLSPHQFGIPQIRDRIFLVGSRGSLSEFSWPAPTDREPALPEVLSPPSDPERFALPPHYVECLDAWQEFLDGYPRDRKLPSFPVWSMEFGANYPFERTTPWAAIKSGAWPTQADDPRGSHGRILEGQADPETLLEALPSYARTDAETFPKWKERFIRQNRSLYRDLKPWIDDWLPSILPFPSSLQKLEWNFKGGERSIWSHVIQFRASGVRIKRPTTAPSLVAMTTTQIPVVGGTREKARFMTMKECARLQSMDSLEALPDSTSRAVKALGNAVNVDVVKLVAEQLVGRVDDQPPSEANLADGLSEAS